MSSIKVGEIIERQLDRRIEEAGVLLSHHIGKGKRVALDAIQAALPSCPPEVLTVHSFHNIPTPPSELCKDCTSGHSKQLGLSRVQGWFGEKGYEPAFDITTFRMREQLKYQALETKNGGALKFFKSITEPVTLTQTTDHAFHIISEDGDANKLVHEAWIEGGKMCESLTSTAAKDHVFQCTEGALDQLPLLKQACVIRDRPPVIAAEPAQFDLVKGVAFAIGAIALIKAAQNVRTDKVRALAWAVGGVASIALTRFI